MYGNDLPACFGPVLSITPILRTHAHAQGGGIWTAGGLDALEMSGGSYVSLNKAITGVGECE